MIKVLNLTPIIEFDSNLKVNLRFHEFRPHVVSEEGFHIVRVEMAIVFLVHLLVFWHVESHLWELLNFVDWDVVFVAVDVDNL